MYCPNCGAKTSSEHKFCRACGLGLEKIAHSLHEQLPTRVDDHSLSQKERFERVGMALLSVFGFGLLTLIVYGVVYKLMVTQGQWLGGLAMLGFIIMAACGLLATIFFAKAKEAENAAGKRRVEKIETTPTKELLTEGHFEPVPSVTDRTTDLLYVEKKDAQRR